MNWEDIETGDRKKERERQRERRKVCRVNSKAGSHVLLLVQALDSGVSLVLGAEGNESESSGSAGLAVAHDDLFIRG
jgi:hypothetical protein